MDLDGLFRRYFGNDDVDALNQSALAAGVERMLVDFGLSRDRNERFALWSLLFALGAAPELEVAFPDPADRDAARDLMDLLAKGEDPSP